MSFPDDHSSPAQPFSGDGAGDIFDAPDAVPSFASPGERSVDTQSGFLVVVRQQKGRPTLSVRRRLGTPPSSTIALTPDEAARLSRVLADAAAGFALAVPDGSDFDDGQFSPAARLRRRSGAPQAGMVLWLVAVVVAAATGIFAGIHMATDRPADAPPPDQMTR